MVTLYVATRDALLVVDGGPGDWQPSTRLSEHALACLAVHPDQPRRLFCGTSDAGVLRSDDGGDTWSRVGESVVDSGAVTALATNPDDPKEVWVGTEPSAVYHSTDGGDVWTEKTGLTDLPSASSWSFPPRPETHHVRWIEVDPVDPSHLYVAVEAGALVQTHDRGETWEGRVDSSRIDTHSMATHPDVPGRAWAAAGDGYAETSDGGETWQYPQKGLSHRYCWSVVVDEADPRTVLVSSASGAYAAHTASRAETYVYRKREHAEGVQWERLDGRGLPTGDGVTRAVLAAGDTGGEFYAANDQGLFHTTDSGDSWRRLSIEWPESFESEPIRGLVVVD
ncbi:Photosynthesis system II assembly factor YCF48 [Halogranum amylolyticum]|uniref:Photosynthesis system II assembly factor YCF48 n=1 Tax=Halogranum amylolyticum TaxID=660520 RepID=A0A1H8QCC2_9EURY|nr:YCF48-related protein [Halogranum amylolyticum]SEO51875.1 Photosynthesis system II assembly factor YCF48 [Halogranum amylolyticum]